MEPTIGSATQRPPKSLMLTTPETAGRGNMQTVPGAAHDSQSIDRTPLFPGPVKPSDSQSIGRAPLVPGPGEPSFSQTWPSTKSFVSYVVNAMSMGSNSPTISYDQTLQTTAVHTNPTRYRYGDEKAKLQRERKAVVARNCRKRKKLYIEELEQKAVRLQSIQNDLQSIFPGMSTTDAWNITRDLMRSFVAAGKLAATGNASADIGKHAEDQGLEKKKEPAVGELLCELPFEELESEIFKERERSMGIDSEKLLGPLLSTNATQLTRSNSSHQGSSIDAPNNISAESSLPWMAMTARSNSCIDDLRMPMKPKVDDGVSGIRLLQEPATISKTISTLCEVATCKKHYDVCFNNDAGHTFDTRERHGAKYVDDNGCNLHLYHSTHSAARGESARNNGVTMSSCSSLWNRDTNFKKITLFSSRKVISDDAVGDFD